MEEEGYKLFSLLREHNEIFSVVHHLGENGVYLNADTPTARSIISSVLQQNNRQRQDELLELRNILISLGKESYLQTDDFTKAISTHAKVMTSGVKGIELSLFCRYIVLFLISFVIGIRFGQRGI